MCKFNLRKTVSITAAMIFALFLAAPSLTLADCVEPPSGLVGWWPGDGDSLDISGNGNDGSNNGVFVAGKVDQAFSIGGNYADEIIVANSGVLEPAQVTVDAWVRADNGDDFAFKWIVAKGARDCESPSYGFFTTDNVSVRFLVSDGATFGIAIANVGLWDGDWHHIAGTYDGTDVKIYVDGQLEDTVPYAGPIAYGLNVSNDLRIGGYDITACPPSPPGNNFAFAGDVDEVEIFDRALTQPEIQAIFDADSDGKCKVKTIAIDIKPGSDPNCFNINGKGVVPVALLGSEDFDVEAVDQESLTFNGLVVQDKGKGLLCHVTDVNGDEFPDLVCQFEDDLSMWIDNPTGILMGVLEDNTPIMGEDSICLRPPEEEE